MTEKPDILATLRSAREIIRPIDDAMTKRREKAGELFRLLVSAPDYDHARDGDTASWLREMSKDPREPLRMHVPIKLRQRRDQ